MGIEQNGGRMKASTNTYTGPLCRDQVQRSQEVMPCSFVRNTEDPYEVLDWCSLHSNDCRSFFRNVPLPLSQFGLQDRLHQEC